MIVRDGDVINCDLGGWQSVRNPHLRRSPRYGARKGFTTRCRWDQRFTDAMSRSVSDSRQEQHAGTRRQRTLFGDIARASHRCSVSRTPLVGGMKTAKRSSAFSSYKTALPHVKLAERQGSCRKGASQPSISQSTALGRLERGLRHSRRLRFHSWCRVSAVLSACW